MHAQWRHVLWVCRQRKNWNVFCVRESSKDLQNIVTLQQQQDLITLSEFAHTAINKMHLFSFSVAHACYCPNLTATTGYHSVHNTDIGKLLAHTTPNSPSAICLVRWNPSIHAEHVSPKCQMQGAQSTPWCDCRTHRWAFLKPFWPARTWNANDSANQLLHQLSGWMFSGKLCWWRSRMWSSWAVVATSVIAHPVGCDAKFSEKIKLEMMWNWAAALVMIPAVQSH